MRPLIVFAIITVPVMARTCEDLARIALPGATITTAQSVPAGTFTPPEGKAHRKTARVLPRRGCHQASERFADPIRGVDAQLGLERKVSGHRQRRLRRVHRLQRHGRRGEPRLRHRFHRYGHHGAAPDASWALGHPEKIVDFGYRAIHETAEKAKTLIRSFYGEQPKRSYFSSCSNGGRQALMEAQRYPDDYDGIIAGAPANFWTHLLTQAAWDIQATMQDPSSYIPASKLPAIEAAVLARCDELDGVKDGVIGDPSRCSFDPSELLCKGQESDSCLTGPQVAALKKIYAGPKTSTGQQVMPGFPPGGETGGGGWGLWVTGPAPGKSLQYAFGTQFFSNMLYNNAAWDYHTFNVDRDVKAADAKMAPILNATDPDLTAFKEHGGKLILYHGWSDAAIPAVERD